MSSAAQVYEAWLAVVYDEDEGLTGVQTEGATDEELGAFEKHFAVKLPASFRELYRLSNGTTDVDGHEQIFWPLSAMKNAYLDPGDPNATWLGFADFRLQAATLYLRIDRATAATSVWLDRKEPLTATFDDYLTCYAEAPLFWTPSGAEDE